MDQYKFRGYDDFISKMEYYDDLIAVAAAIEWRREEGHEFDLTIMQFTGILDKKGNGIYEGDIITDYEGYRQNVVFDDGGFWCKKPNGTRYMPSIEYREVVGNLYENQEPANKIT